MPAKRSFKTFCDSFSISSVAAVTLKKENTDSYKSLIERLEKLEGVINDNDLKIIQDKDKPNYPILSENFEKQLMNILAMQSKKNFEELKTGLFQQTQQIQVLLSKQTEDFQKQLKDGLLQQSQNFQSLLNKQSELFQKELKNGLFLQSKNFESNLNKQSEVFKKDLKDGLFKQNEGFKEMLLQQSINFEQKLLLQSKEFEAKLMTILQLQNNNAQNGNVIQNNV